MTRPVLVWLCLGSNRGDRLLHLRSGMAGLRRLPRTRVAAVSRSVESSAVGARGQRDYLNRAALVRTRLSPMGLLAELKRIEAASGRRPDKRWSPRTLDIDILYYGGLRLRSRLLILPHPRVLRRRFALAALADLNPGFRPPEGGGAAVSRLLARLNAPSQNVTVHQPRPRRPTRAVAR